MEKHHLYIQRAVELAKEGVLNDKGGPFGAVIVKDGKIVGEGSNMVTSQNDPTAHAEVVAIRNACKNLNSFQLTGCTIYASCEPCPMCLGAIYWARPDKLIFACTKEDAKKAGFDDQFIYEEIDLPYSERKITTEQNGRDIAIEVFKLWQVKKDRIDY
ncbi:nucleoside deaminase [Chondrinema litorale]|uniref:nucleoside deaminase n=1 Tax=Chondrinema litorale TaxID=2994555 RepID=UPI0025437286|nr:nucleoside deaminase [Chondrinema litorale]UZR95825.1 nucleoside deaminase [Chondrinema litorale]